jgi:hypothetical protein
MKIFSELKRLAEQLKEYDGSWALCGGVVASIYRQAPRFTADIDVAIVDRDDRTAEELASEILINMKYTPIVGFVPNMSGVGGQQKALVCARNERDAQFIGIDFLLPVFPWIPTAVQRAQHNKVDYGFSRLPTITVEDLLVAKICALRAVERSQDAEDIRSVLKSSLDIDLDQVLKEAARLKLAVPQWVCALFENR